MFRFTYFFFLPRQNRYRCFLNPNRILSDIFLILFCPYQYHIDMCPYREAVLSNYLYCFRYRYKIFQKILLKWEFSTKFPQETAQERKKTHVLGVCVKISMECHQNVCTQIRPHLQLIVRIPNKTININAISAFEIECEISFTKH